MRERINTAEQTGHYERLSKLARGWTIVKLLFCGGSVLVTIGSAGVLGLLGSVSRASLFNPPPWVNWLHLCFGTFVLTVAIVGNKKLQLSLALLAAVAGTILGIADLLAGPAVRNGVSELNDRSDPLTHLAVGILAIWALRNSTRTVRAG